MGTEDTLILVEKAVDGDQQGWNALSDRYRNRIRRMASHRMDRRISKRVDISDVIQEVYLEASKNLSTFLKNPQSSFYGWLQGITKNKMLEIHRHHMGTQKRSTKREVSMESKSENDTNPINQASAFVSDDTRPNDAVMKAEMSFQLKEAMDTLDAADREILQLRHFEQLSNREAAEALGIETSAASKRYIRALARIKTVLTAADPDGDSDGN